MKKTKVIVGKGFVRELKRTSMVTPDFKLYLKDVWVSKEFREKTRGKEHRPDIFLGVATAMRASPRECVVIEDAEKGILAAAVAAMLSIAVPNLHTRHNDFSKATMVLRSLEELTLEAIDMCDQLHPTIESNTTSS